MADNEQHDLHPSRVCERPKVVFNEKTGKFVMWVHIDDAKNQMRHGRRDRRSAHRSVPLHRELPPERRRESRHDGV